MSNINSRAIQILDASKLSNPALEEKTGIPKTTWANVRLGKIRFNEDHIEAITKLWPEYSYWLISGKTMPEVGEISPDIEETRIRQGLRKVG